MFGKKSKPESEMTQEELNRREIVRRRCLGVIVVLDVLILLYLIIQMIMVFNN